MYLVGIYVAAILIFGGIYVTIGNMTKVRYMEVLKEGLGIRAKIRANKKEMKVIAKTIRRDKNETVYNLQKFDDEIAQLDQDAAEINRKKKEALTTFDTVTRTIISVRKAPRYADGCEGKSIVHYGSLRGLYRKRIYDAGETRGACGYREKRCGIQYQ